MIIKKNERGLEVDEMGVKIFDYDLKTDHIGLSYQELNGRVPKKGYGVNPEVDEWYMILGGSGTVTIDSVTDDISAGDVVCIPKGGGSCMHAKSIRMVTITSPNWYESQYRSVD